MCVYICGKRERGTSGRTLSNKNFESLSYSFHINMSRGLIFEPVRYFMIYCCKLLKLLIREKFIFAERVEKELLFKVLFDHCLSACDTDFEIGIL